MQTLTFKYKPLYPKAGSKEFKVLKKLLYTPHWNMEDSENNLHTKLEEEFAEYLGKKQAIAVASGGTAIQMSLRALGMKPGQEVIHINF